MDRLQFLDAINLLMGQNLPQRQISVSSIANNEHDHYQKLKYKFMHESQTQPMKQLREYQLQCFPDSQFVEVNEQYLDMFRCPINHGILNDPVQDQHGHLFCKPCISAWLKIKSTCPVTNLPITNRLHVISQPMQQLLAKFRLKCVNEGCTWIGSSSELENHLNTLCPQEKIPCRHEGCRANLPRQQETIHQQECSFRKIDCQYCDEFKSKAFYLYEVHLLNTCQEVRVKCANCSFECQQKNLNKHMEQCQYLTCKVCTMHVLKGRLREHFEDNLGSHIAIIGQKCKKVKKMEEELNGSINFSNFNEKLQHQVSAKAGVNLYFGSSCHDCHKALATTTAQYYCPTCLITLCESCGDKIDSTKNGTAGLSHSHYLVYIKVKSNKGMKNIDEKRFGRNIQFQKGTKENETHPMLCNGCGVNGPSGIRWICLSCPSTYTSNNELGCEWLDLCNNCMSRIKNPSQKQNGHADYQQEFQDKLIAQCPDHDFDSHVYLRINLSTNKYVAY